MNEIKYWIILFLSTLSFNLNAQTCLPNGISFTNQSQIDNFRINHPGCQIIEGGITINDTNVNNLDSLIDITTINGTLYLNDNAAISLLGLQNVTSLGGLIIKDDGLNHFQGLENLEIIYGDLRIDDCYGISTMGLSSLREIQGELYLEDNNGLIITDLLLLEKISGSLIIEENEVSNLEGLLSVQEINGQLIVSENTLLSSLAGLDSINPQSITELVLSSSDSLSFCSVKSVCDYLSMNLGPSSIGQNLTGCNTADEILSLCPNTTGVLNLNHSSIQIQPNPVDDWLHIRHELSDVSDIIIYNYNGAKLLHFPYNIKDINLDSLAGGMYIIAIKSRATVYYAKFMKLD